MEVIPQELIEWLDNIRKIGIAPASGNTLKSYFLNAIKKDGTQKNFRCLPDPYDAEDKASLLWNTGNWKSIAINGVPRYPIKEN